MSDALTPRPQSNEPEPLLASGEAPGIFSDLQFDTLTPEQREQLLTAFERTIEVLTDLLAKREAKRASDASRAEAADAAEAIQAPPGPEPPQPALIIQAGPAPVPRRPAQKRLVAAAPRPTQAVNLGQAEAEGQAFKAIAAGRMLVQSARSLVQATSPDSNRAAKAHVLRTSLGDILQGARPISDILGMEIPEVTSPESVPAEGKTLHLDERPIITSERQVRRLLEERGSDIEYPLDIVIGGPYGRHQLDLRFAAEPRRLGVMTQSVLGMLAELQDCAFSRAAVSRMLGAYTRWGQLEQQLGPYLHVVPYPAIKHNAEVAYLEAPATLPPGSIEVSADTPLGILRTAANEAEREPYVTDSVEIDGDRLSLAALNNHARFIINTMARHPGKIYTPADLQKLALDNFVPPHKHRTKVRYAVNELLNVIKWRRGDGPHVADYLHEFYNPYKSSRYRYALLLLAAPDRVGDYLAAAGLPRDSVQRSWPND